MKKIAPILSTLLVLADVGWWSRRGDSWPDNVWNDLFLADMVATFIIFAVAGLGVP